ncbi:hypothetical protein [Streptomyces sp. NPDC007883]|uniref:hypothetical protein n=1 Tax=Streptomyces sp. NPDC007883 TaxID=3155116 RepID=UPI0033CC3E33
MVNTNHTPTNADPSTAEKVMAIIIAVCSGMIAGLVTFIVSRHLHADALEAIVYSGASFLGVSGFVKVVEEKLGLL